MGNGPAISSSHDSWNGTELTAKELRRGRILHMGRMRVVFKDTILARRNALSSCNKTSGRTQKLLSSIHSAITERPLNVDSPQCLPWKLATLILKIWKQQQGWENQSGRLLSDFWPLSPFIFDNSEKPPQHLHGGTPAIWKKWKSRTGPQRPDWKKLTA